MCVCLVLQVIPGTLELVQQSRCGCSVAEVLRMERCILDKLGWDLHCITPPLYFLQVLHSLLLATHPCLLAVAAAGRQLAVLTAKLSLLLTDHRSMLQPPSMLALALLTLELQSVWPQWLVATITLQHFTGVSTHYSFIFSIAITHLKLETKYLINFYNYLNF